MSLRINTNIMALNTHRNMQMTDLALARSLEKLSSGLRVNRASDDAAGLSISENLRAQIRGLAQAERNAQDGISLINTAEGALNEVHSILQRMRELSVQAANGTLSTTDRTSVNNEFQALIAEIDNITSNTKFNGMALFDGTFDTTLTAAPDGIKFQVGANSGQELEVSIPVVSGGQLGLYEAADGSGDGIIDPTDAADIVTDADTNGVADMISIASQPLAQTAINRIDTAIRTVSGIRSSLGAVSNRLEYTINNAAISRENLAAAESRIRDVDMASEMSRLTRAQILMQSGTAMLAQANSSPQTVLGLLA